MITKLQDRLNNFGILAPRPERVDEDFENSIRYFHESDIELARRVAEIAEDFFRENDCSAAFGEPKFLSHLSSKAPRGQVEIWIHQSCN